MRQLNMSHFALTLLGPSLAGEIMTTTQPPFVPFYLLLFLLAQVAACDSTVKVTDACGDGILDPNEACDLSQFGANTCLTEGYYTGDLVCNADCTLEVSGCSLTCGDGLVQIEHEDCDRNDLQGRSCTDFGFFGGALACSEACKFDYTDCQAECGDGAVALNEGCDDGDRDDDDGCSGGCTVEPGWDCVGTPSLCTGHCGDGAVVGDEVCDDGVNDGAYGGCMPGCAALAPRCGDGQLQTDEGEVCDGADTAGRTCADNGFFGGPIACWDTCDQLDLTRCVGASVWSLSAGAVSWENGMSVAFDPAGNVIVAGLFTGVLNLGGQDLTAVGVSEIFLAKFDPSGAHVWSRQFGTSGGDNVNSVATDSAGNILITGAFSDTLNLGGGALLSAGSADIYLAKLSPTGDHVWSKRFGDGQYQEGMRVAVDAADAVVLAGVFEGSVNFGGTHHNAGSGRDVFISRYNSIGAFIFSDTLREGGVFDSVRGLATDPSGNVYVTGAFGGTVYYGGNNAVSTGGLDIYVAKFNQWLTPQWLKVFGSATYDDEGGALVVDALQNLFVTGKAGPSSSFGGGPIAGFGLADCFIMRIDSSGNTVWAQMAGSADLEAGGFAVGLDPGGRLWVAGNFTGAANFGGTYLTGLGTMDFFLAQFEADGQYGFVQRFGGTGSDVAYSMRVSPAGKVAVTGMFQSSMTIGEDLLTSHGAEDFFLAYFQ